MPPLKIFHVGYGPYKDKYELEEAELNAWLAIPLSERKEIMKKASVEYDTPEKRAAYIAKWKK